MTYQIEPTQVPGGWMTPDGNIWSTQAEALQMTELAKPPLTTPTRSFRTVIGSGTFAVICYTDRDVTGTIELATDARGTEAVAIGHAKFIAPHVINWNVVEVA